MKKLNMSSLKADAGISLGGEEEESNLNGFVAGRQKLKGSLNFKRFLESKEGEFEVDMNPEANQIPSGKGNKKLLDGCDFRNIMVEAVTDDNDEILMFADFKALAKSMSPITEDNGVRKKVDKAGQKGKFPPPHAKVWIYYTAVCEAWDEPIDKTNKNGKPKAFKLGCGAILPALEIGVATMELKEVAKFLATPEYAYGPLGLVDRCPKNATILFTVELFDFMEVTAINSVFKLNPEDRARVDYKEIHKYANEMKQDGNRFCKEKDWHAAITKYRRGVKTLDRYSTIDKGIDKTRNDLLFILYTNLAQCYLSIQDYEKVIQSCQLALNLPPETEGNKCKAYYRQSKAKFHLGHFVEAKELIRLALKLEPCNTDVRTFYDELCKRLERDEQIEKMLSKKMLSGMNLN